MKCSPKTFPKRLIVAIALNELCKTSQMESVTIDSICEVSKVSRSTFYRIFPDKYEIPLWAQKFTLRVGLEEIGRTLTCVEGLQITHEGFLHFKDLIRSSTMTRDRLSADNVGKREYIASLTTTLEDYKGIPIDKELSFQINYTAMAGANIAAKWLSDEISATPSELAVLLDSCFPARLYKLINEPVNPKPAGHFNFNNFILSTLAEEEKDEPIIC